MPSRPGGLLILLLFGIATIVAQDNPSAALHQAVLSLSHDGVLMNLSAHPDDEDGASLALYRMRYGVKTYSVLLTRGEGGQNEKGPELYEDLGVLRSMETEEAGRILGAEVHFLNFLDFGYSKTASEAFRMWGGHNEVLRRLVYVIRKYKPDVLFTNHNTIDGHGHHQAAAIAAIAAFDASGDSTYFPEQLREPGIALWQPRKLFFRAFGRSEPTADVSNNINDADSSLHMSYLEIAAKALRMHRTQGLERANLAAFTRGKSLYKLVRSNSLYDQDSTTFFAGINLFHDPSVSVLAPLRAELSRIRPAMAPDSILALIAAVLARCDSLRRPSLSVVARRMIEHWEEEGERLASLVSGLTVTCRFRDTVVVPHQRVVCDLAVSSDRYSVGGVRWTFSLPQGWIMEETGGSAPQLSTRSDIRSFTLTVGENAEPTIPKNVTQYRSLGQPQEVIGHVSIAVNGRRIQFTVRPSLEVAPRQSIEVSPRTAALLQSRTNSGITVQYTVRNYLPHKTAGRIGFRTPAGWSADNASFTIADEDSVARGRLNVRPPANIPAGEYVVHARTEMASEPLSVRVIDARLVPGVALGIVKSYDTTLESAAATLGVDYTLLSDTDLAKSELSRFTTIVVDIRAYLVREGLKANNNRLLEYVRNGGNLVVMYQREAEWKPEYAPYPFQLSRQRVCDEIAPVTILTRDHPLMKSPNLIGDEDWVGWKQERAVYFPTNVSENYTRLLSSGDPDEQQLTTGYLAAGWGKGSYIYTSYVWYRQMKEGNPGAYRCFANMISYPAYRPATP